MPPIDDGGRAAGKLDLVLPPGALRWTMIEYAPGAEFSMHHTDTVDFDVVLSGSVELVLDDGDHLLEPGDSAVITGVDHGWRAGPRGCRLDVLTIAALASRPASVWTDQRVSNSSIELWLCGRHTTTTADDMIACTSCAPTTSKCSIEGAARTRINTRPGRAAP